MSELTEKFANHPLDGTLQTLDSALGRDTLFFHLDLKSLLNESPAPVRRSYRTSRNADAGFDYSRPCR
jgi:hypothetical protein